MIIKTIMSVAGNSSSHMLGESDYGQRFWLLVLSEGIKSENLVPTR